MKLYGGLLKNGSSPIVMFLVCCPWLWYTMALSMVSIVCLESIITHKQMISSSRFCFRMGVIIIVIPVVTRTG